MSPSLVGRTLLNEFRVDSFIAAGGMGEVYKAWDVRRSVFLAMKVLRTDLYDDPVALKRFQREAEALRTLAHPNIVPFYGLYKDDDIYFLLERFVDGASLADLLKKRRGNPLPVGEALIYLKSLCAALGYAHAQDVVHCDVKPGNLMIDSGGSIFLTDFGIARYSTSGTTSTLGPAGTPAYMAPEQIRGESLTPAGDIYAIGLILFEMVTGQRPFRGDEPGLDTPGSTLSERIRTAHLSILPPDPCSLRPDLPPGLGEVILRALAKDPGARFRSAIDLLNAAAAASGVSPSQIPDRVIVTRPVQVQPPVDQNRASPTGPPGGTPPPGSLPTIDFGSGSRPITPPTFRQRPRSLVPFLAAGGLVGVLLLGGLFFLGARWVLNLVNPTGPGPTNTPTQVVQMLRGPTLVQATAQPGEPTGAPELPTNTPVLPSVTPSIPASGEKDGMELVEVPAGKFSMGSNTSSWAFERPVHTVYLDAFWIDKTEITNAMFTRFVEDTGYITQAERAGAGYVYTNTFVYMDGADWRHPHGPGSSLSGRELYPVVQVSWNDAQAYCTWAGRRLPTEAEWEKAARGENAREYPWGEGLSCAQANYKDCVGDAVRVGSYPVGASPYGVLDMAGNVWEWVADYYSETYYSISPSENPTGPVSETKRVHRGGGWYDLPAHVRTAYRYGNPPEWTFNSVGIRCAEDR